MAAPSAESLLAFVRYAINSLYYLVGYDGGYDSVRGVVQSDRPGSVYGVSTSLREDAKAPQIEFLGWRSATGHFDYDVQ